MSDDDRIFEPYEKLIAIVVLGRRVEVPERNTLLRQCQHACPDVGTGPFCWNTECRKCEVEYSLGPEAPRWRGLACQLRGLPGMIIHSATPELRFALGALRR